VKVTRILVIDVGGSHVKALVTRRRVPVKIPAGPAMTARDMVRGVRKATAGWSFDAVSIGFPGPVVHGKPAAEPKNLGPGWVGFNFTKAFGRPVKIINDAAMQALGSYRGARMLFLGLGTGLGSALTSTRCWYRWSSRTFRIGRDAPTRSTSAMRDGSDSGRRSGDAMSSIS
jgi:predicted NBD/HSP70 family sugar kinase